LTNRRAVISLLTDFGTVDPFVGVMKGVILGVNPDATIVDITHEIPPQDITGAAHHLAGSWPWFPPGTVHVAVVDPGVGSRRRAIAVSAEGHYFVAPDNGILTEVLHAASAWRAVAITERHYLAPRPSGTFHGRDVFAPAAAHLSKGTALDNLGPEIVDPVLAPGEIPRVEGGTIRARVVHVDRFGNLVLNVDRTILAAIAGAGGPGEAGTAGRATAAGEAAGDGDEESRALAALRLAAEAGGRRIDRFVTHYAEAGSDPCFLIDSNGRLEIAIPGRSASAHLGLARGSEILVQVAS
jgi:S-adenosylmethionine hydrolase